MSSFGRQYRVTTFGESHAKAVGVIIENFPSNFSLDLVPFLSQVKLQLFLNRRRPGQSSLTTQRDEKDQLIVQSGLENGVTLGSPICILVNNQDQKPGDYKRMESVPRPGHADITYLKKYGIKSASGGGRSSARETISRVLAGGVALQFLNLKYKIEIFSWVSQIGSIKIPQQIQDALIHDQLVYDIDQLGKIDMFKNEQEDILYLQDKDQKKIVLYKDKIYQLNQEAFAQQFSGFQYSESVNTRCPDFETSVKMIQLIAQIRQEKDSIGGIVTCVCKNVPIGLGEPCFDKVRKQCQIQAQLAHAMMSIPATKGFEYGSGFDGITLRGSQHNDTFYMEDDKFRQHSNHAGGALGGITNGENIYFRVAFKPVSTIGLPQQTCDLEGKEVTLEAKGRHDPCVLPRAPPIVDSMSAMVIMDALLQQQTQWYNQNQ